MITNLSQVIRPTVIVRQILRMHGVPTFLMFTNSYKSCNTVKAYPRDVDNITDAVKDITFALTQAGVTGFEIKQNPRAMIVCIPK